MCYIDLFILEDMVNFEDLVKIIDDEFFEVKFGCDMYE